MRTWVKVTLGGVALVATAFLVLGGTAAYFVFRHMDTRKAGQAEAFRDMDAVRARFGARPPLVEISDPRRGDIRINRDPGADGAPVETIHIINWKADTGEVMRTQVPLWLMRFSTVNVLSRLGIGPARLRLTVSDIQRYGPGIVADYSSPGELRVLVWVD